MQRREGGLTRWVPSAEDDPAVRRVVLDLVDAVGELIHALALVVGLAVDILCAEVSPLEAVHRAEVAFFAMRETSRVEEGPRAVAVPDVNVLLAEEGRVGRAGHKPEQLLRGQGGIQRQICLAQGQTLR